jgi:hypothetical protein
MRRDALPIHLNTAYDSAAQSVAMGRLAAFLSKEAGVSPLLCLLLEPCSRAGARASQCFKTILEHINWLDCTIRPFSLELPSVAIAQHNAENRLGNSRTALFFPLMRNPSTGTGLRAWAQGRRIAARAASRLPLPSDIKVTSAVRSLAELANLPQLLIDVTEPSIDPIHKPPYRDDREFCLSAVMPGSPGGA